jgi:hypothetical protein
MVMIMRRDRFGILYSLISFAILIVVSTSCRKILFNEAESTREIKLDSFHGVIFKGIYNIYLIQDSTDRLIIRGRNHIASIDAEVIKDTLKISLNKGFSLNTNKNSLELHFSNIKFIRTLDPVYISNKDTLKLENIVFETIGEITETNLNLNCNFLNVATSANTLGYQRFRGSAESCVFFCRYGSSFFADSLKCKTAEVINDSAGDIIVNASGNLKVYIWQNGNVSYKGSPIVEILSHRGSGKLVHLK